MLKTKELKINYIWQPDDKRKEFALRFVAKHILKNLESLKLQLAEKEK